jgi:hypothetical protein
LKKAGCRSVFTDDGISGATVPTTWSAWRTLETTA